MTEYPNQNDQYIDEMPEPNDSQLKRIVALANEYVDIAWQLERLKAQLALLEKQYDDLGQVILPDMMQQAGLSEFRLENGYRLRVRPVLGCSVLKEKLDIAEAWLDANGHSGLVKHRLQVDIPKGDNPHLLHLQDTLKSCGLEYEDIKRIHPQTLNRWAREMKENNDQIPTDIFNVYEGYRTEINK